jgi:diguanylate cyclase (GGDEF)-like protein/PAS domain S-box-containing protein
MKQRISLQIAIAISLLALMSSMAVSTVLYFHIYHEEVAAAQDALLQLAKTVQSSATDAAYLNDTRLATDITRGLAQNELVAAVKLTSTSGLSIPADAMAPQPGDHVVQLKLTSPVTANETIGELHITLRQDKIQARARKMALENALIMAGYTLFIALVIFLLIQWRFSSGINQLLSLTEDNLDNERALLNQVETLESRFRMIYERAGVGIFLMDQHARLIMANPAFYDIVGETNCAHIMDRDVNCMNVLFGDSDNISQLIAETFNKGKMSASDLLIITTDKMQHWVHCLLTPVRDDSSTLPDQAVTIQGIITDISERKRAEQKMRFQAERDPLTHLLNRRSAQHSLHLMLEKTRFEDGHIAVCLLDLDNFKPINDSHGHDAGDKVLTETAQRMTSTLRNSDLVARLGGDEFLLVIQATRNRQDMERLLEKLINSITRDIDIGNGVTVQIGASIGIALSPNHSTNLDQLLSFADQAMYQVKQNGKKGYQFYN